MKNSWVKVLVAWTEFLKNPDSPKVRDLEKDIKEIKEAKDELIKLSADEEQRRLYSIRAKRLKDEASALNKAKREGIEQGIFNERINTAKSMSITQLEKQDIEQL